MHWSEVAKHWPTYLPLILDRWPDLDEEELRRLAGDHDAFLRHLIQLFDGDEVAANLEMADWLRVEAPRHAARVTKLTVESGAHVSPRAAANRDEETSASKAATHRVSKSS